MESCLFLCLVAITAGAVSAQQYPQMLVNGALGRSVELNLNFTIPQNRQITWSAGGGSIFIARITNNGVPIYRPSYENRVELFPSGTLRLDKLTTDDQREYNVIVENQTTFSSQTRNYQLDVYPVLNTPELKINSITGYLINGTNMTLHCDAGSQNVTTYNFYRDQKPVCSENHHVTCNGSFLHFQPVEENDSGLYNCTIENLVSTSTSNALILTVIMPISSVTLISNTSGLLLPGIDSVSLDCSARGTNVSYSWSMDGVKLLNQDKSLLIISPVSSKDNGSFTCTATDIISNKTSNKVVLDLVRYPEENITCGVNINKNASSFVCSWVNGHPAANVTMIFNGTTETRPNIVSRDVDLNAHSQGSNFTCIGDQLGRTSTCVLQLEPPRSSGHDNNAITKATEGEKVVLTVTLDSKSTSQSPGTVGGLPALFTWYRFNPDKTEIKSGGGFLVTSTDYVSTLSITNVTRAYSGKYECIATNLVGNESFVFNINVTEKLNPPENDKNGLNGGEIAGIVIGVLAGLTIIGIIVFFILKKN